MAALLTRIPRAALAVAALCLAWLEAGCSLVNQDLPNVPPIVQVSEADTTTVPRGGRVRLIVSASDEDDDPLSYRWSSGGAGSFQDTTASSTVWIAPDEIAGHSEFFLLSVTIVDHQPDTEDPVQTFLIEVVQRPPELTAPADTVVSFREPELLLQASATDADGDPLTFEWEFREGGLAPERIRAQVRTRNDTSTLRLITLEPGVVPLALTVTDGQDTLRHEFRATVVGPDMPDGGTVRLDLPLPSGGTRAYEIDAYEYPNQRGVEPQLVDDWFQARRLCSERGMRLCTIEEWVYACRGADSLAYSSTDDRADLPEAFGERYCNVTGSDLAGDEPTLTTVAPSGSFPNCTSGTGVFDLTGNAFEWMAEWVPPERDATSTVGVGHRGAFSTSSTLFADDACSATSSLALIQLQGDLPIPTPQSFIDSVLAVPIDEAAVEGARNDPNFAGYFDLRRGFRCCR